MTVKRTWREGSDEESFKALLLERDSILDVPPKERPPTLMNRYRDIAEKIRGWKRLFPHIDIKRPSKAAAKKKAADKVRLSTKEAKAATRARMATEENKAKTRARVATEKNKTADRERKAAKTLAKQQEKFWPQAPEFRYAGAWEGYAGYNKHCKSVRPTCVLGEPLELKLNVKCFPAPIHIWKKDGIVIGREVSGGSLIQRTKEVKGAVLRTNDISFEESAAGSKDLSSENDNSQPITNHSEQEPILTKQHIPERWEKGSLQLSTHWMYWC